MIKSTKLIVHVVQHLAPGGLESLALDMLTFSSTEQRCLIISLEGEKSQAIEHWPRLSQYREQLIFLDKPQGFSLSTIVTLRQLFKSLNPNVVHTHHIGPVLYAGIAARLAGVATRIHTEHDAWHLNQSKHRRLQSLALRIAQPQWVADAELVREQINQHFHHHSVSVIKNGIDCEKFKPGAKHLARQLLNLPTDVTLIGCAGRLEPVKGHDLLLKAMVNLPDHIHLVIAGDGSQRHSLTQLAHQLHIQHRVTFTGLLCDMTRFYQALDLFCLPSRSEGFPLSTLEAQSCDVVTVVTDVGASKETICPQSGICVKPGCPESLAYGIMACLKQSPATSPRSFVIKNNDIRKMIKAYNQLSGEKQA